MHARFLLVLATPAGQLNELLSLYLLGGYNPCGDTQRLQRLKDILVSFSSFTGLHINFDKSTFIPMNISDEDARTMASTLGCSISSFPQPNLGLPLSASKLRVSDLQPLIDRFDSYFAG